MKLGTACVKVRERERELEERPEIKGGKGGRGGIGPKLALWIGGVNAPKVRGESMPEPLASELGGIACRTCGNCE